ncbi:MAG: MG2 domain-containing protein [Planctomycetaceae bacterium]
MRLALVTLLLTAVVSTTGLMATVFVQDRDAMRQQADQLMKDGNWAEAWDLLEKLSRDAANTDRRLAQDLRKAVQCLNTLNRTAEFDDYLESVIAAHPADWRLLSTAASLLQGSVPHEGFRIAGQFERGYHRGGGESVSAENRDRVRSLQLILDSIEAIRDDESATAQERAQLYKQLADSIGAHRFGEAWRLQDITDLSTLPDYDKGAGYRYGRGFRGAAYGGENKGAPVDSDGNPVFYSMPDSWQTAVNDGQRWRWALDQIVQADPSRRSEIDLEWAGFLQTQFGVASSAIGGPPVVQRIKVAQPEGQTESGVWAAHELSDNETIARLTTGVKRFALPDEFNHLVIFNRVIARNDDHKRAALEAMISVRMNRHQYPQAASLLAERLKVSTSDIERNAVQQRIDQITGNWIQFESASVQAAGRGATVDIRYRNGSSVAFAASPINIDRLLTDVKNYLQSNPDQLDYQKANIGDVGHLLINGDHEKYVGPSIANWTVQLNPPADHFDAEETITTPLQKAGAYWLTAKIDGGNEVRMVIWVADTAITRKRIEDGTLYFAADAVSGAGIANADFEFFGWKQERIDRTNKYRIQTKRFAARADANGICIPDPSQTVRGFQWLSIVRTKDGRLAFDGFNGVWNPDKIDVFSYSPIKVYTITDRPVYRPGHGVKYRLWVRQPRFSEDNARFANQDFLVEVRNAKGEVVDERIVKSDQWAGIDGEYELPADATLGSWQLRVCEPKQGKPENRAVFGVGRFQVEEYRKPEFEVTVDAPDKPVMLGEKIQAKVNATYYFGAPVAEGTVHYKVERTKKDSRWYPVATWDWLYSPGYWWFAPDYTWYPGFERWGCMAPIPPWHNWSPDPPEIVVEGDAELQSDGTFLIDIETAAALANHSDSDHSYSITAEVVDKSRRTIIGSGSVLVARDPYKVFVWTDRGHYRTGDTVNVNLQARTPDGKPVQATGKASLLSVTYDGDKPVEQEVASFDVTTNEAGTASLRMVVPSAGQFRVSVNLTDGEGHQQEGGYVLYVRGPGADGRGYRFNDIELITEKREYQPGETATLQINTNKANSTVLLFVRPANGLCPKPIVLKLNGKSTTFDINIERHDMPNIFVEAVTIADGRIHSEIREIVVPPEQKVANVEVLPAAERYRPGEEATVRLKLTDANGKPFVGNTVLSVYDASLEYIAASAIPEIRSYFWNVRRHHSIVLQSTLQKNFGPLHLPNESVMQVLWGNQPIMRGGRARFGIQARGMGGFGAGGYFDPAPAAPMPMMEAEGAMADSEVAGLSVGRQMMAKSAVAAPGDPNSEATPTVRSNFADTAHWVASVTSDESGIVEVKFTVPDNLTTWKVKAWTLGEGTRVGSGESDIICSKDLIIRPQTPRFFTETDLITLSAVVHNYLDSAKSCRVQLETEGGQLQLLTDAEQVVQIAAGGEVRVDWNVQVIASGNVKVRMKALTDEESDATEYSVPVNVHGIRKTESYTGVIRPDGDSASVTVIVPDKRIEEQSRLEIRYSPSLAGAMIDALPYLVDYPYGCTEQTLNRFLPAAITQQTLLRMGVDLAKVKDQRFQLNAAKTYLGKYPDHWGKPPEIQTRDIRPLPADFGMGSSTLAAWIQKNIDADAKKLNGVGKNFNPVFDEVEMNKIITQGVTDLTNMQLSDGGWGWFSGYGEHSTAHLTSQVVHGLMIARDNGVPVLPDVIQRGVEWLRNYQAEQLVLLREGDWRRENPKKLEKRDKRYKMQADNMDAFVAFVLKKSDSHDAAMNAYLYRDREHLSVYAKALSGLVFHDENLIEQRDMVLRNIEQFLEQDDENQTAWLRMPQNSWWYWYGSEYEAMARYLQLLIKVDPNAERASRLVKYLLNNRQNGTYWKSTRDTALVIEAMADYIKATGEDQPDMTVDVVIDGQVAKTVTINADNFFSFDNSVLLEGDAVKTGQHKIELRRKGTGPLYFNAYLTNFTKEDHITAAGLEVKVDRRFYRLERDDQEVSVQGDRGQVVKQQTAKYKRVPLENLDTVTSGQLIEVELIVDSKNDYEYLLLEDHKPSGFEPDDQLSGYVYEGLRAYRELRDDRVCFFLSTLARGQHSISYRLRAETPSQQVSALPSVIEAMYSPELVGNSDEFKLRVKDQEQ